MSDERHGSGSEHIWRSRLAWLGGAVLGVVLLIAAWGKALDPMAFAEQIANQGLDFVLPASSMAWLVVVGEVVLGLALLLGLRTRPVLVSTGFLIVIFLFLTSRTYWRWAHGIDIGGSDCGCFGNLVSRTPAEAFWQDLFLLVPPFSLCFLGEVRARSARLLGRWGVVGLVGAGVGLLTFLAPSLPIDNLATRLAPGVSVSGLCAGSTSVAADRVCLDLLVPELADGRHLVVVDSLASTDLQSAIEDLNAISSRGNEGVWLIADATNEERQLFFWEWGPLFEIREVPEAVLRPLYRTLPRSFLVADGVVVETWSGMPEVD
jgi:uncharacterized membrane protein YphA (DoxX/SURF4 family)